MLFHSNSFTGAYTIFPKGQIHFSGVCSFHFDDICKQIRVDSGEDPAMRGRDMMNQVKSVW